jgi:hypothetical protein
VGVTLHSGALLFHNRFTPSLRANFRFILMKIFSIQQWISFRRSRRSLELLRL